MVRCTDRRDMTIAVEWDVKHQTKQNKVSSKTRGPNECFSLHSHPYFVYEMRGGSGVTISKMAAMVGRPS